MTRALDMRENQVRAILRAARKERVRVEVKIGDVVITAIPDSHEQGKRPIEGEAEIEL